MYKRFQWRTKKINYEQPECIDEQELAVPNASDIRIRIIDKGRDHLTCKLQNERIMKQKKILLTVALSSFALLALLSCNKSTGTSAGATDSSAIFTATIAGVDWKADSVTARLRPEDHEHEKLITITGFSATRVITIELLDTAATPNDSTMTTRQYNAGYHGDAAFSYLADQTIVGRDTLWKYNGAGSTGQATVTSSNGETKRISGNFNFMARVFVINTNGVSTDSVAVTNGVFTNIPYLYKQH